MFKMLVMLCQLRAKMSAEWASGLFTKFTSSLGDAGQGCSGPHNQLAHISNIFVYKDNHFYLRRLALSIYFFVYLFLIELSNVYINVCMY